MTHKYFCYECNCGFDTPETIEEVRDTISLGGCSYAYTETMYYCPNCGGEGFVDAGDIEVEDEFYVLDLDDDSCVHMIIPAEGAMA